MGLGGSCRPRTALNNAVATDHNAEFFGIWPYRTTTWRTILFYILSFGSCGIFRLILHWFPRLSIDFRAKRCAVEHANLVLVVDNHDRAEICEVHFRDNKSSETTVIANTDGSLLELEELRCFVYRKLRYTWVDGEWITAARAYSNITPHNLLKTKNGLTDDEVSLRRTFFGINMMNAELTPIFEVILKEVLTPFYLFQVFSVIVWIIDDYKYYALLIVAMSTYSIVISLVQTRQQETRIRSMVVEHDEVEVMRNNGRIEKVDSTDLVPGDVLIIPTHGCQLYCDCVLLNGAAIVNESMLTGESIPISKSALADDGHEKVFSIEKHDKNVLFNGTRVLQTKYYKGQHVKAIVIRTGYSTNKGQLVRAIMYPKPADFKFFTALMKFVGVLSIVATLGFIYTTIVHIYRGSSFGKIMIRALDLVTITVPPALPAVMSIGIYYAQKRLRNKSIFCISPTTINTCGAIDVVCFDKTGTLTEDGLAFHALRVVENKNNTGKLNFGDDMQNFEDLDKCQDVVQAVATCHSLSRINHELHGDPLDAILFEKTRFSLEEEEEAEGDEDTSIQPVLVRPPREKLSQLGDCLVLKQFTFSSALQRMSVIVSSNNKMKVYCKGSPEIMLSICRPETIPENFHDVVEEYSQSGYRLIAIAEKEITGDEKNAQKIARGTVESELRLIGIVALENRLKPVTKDVIKQLNIANVRSVMVTGDNILTALSVARECGIIQNGRKAFLIEHENSTVDNRERTVLTLRERCEHNQNVYSKFKMSDFSKLTNSDYQFAISGPTFSVILNEYPEMIEQLVCVCNIFARMAPDQKQILIETLQLVGCTVAMCGDGANDCAALKAAHAGISLSDAEASIAAPFTSKIADIRCIITLIQEGRAALVTSFSAFLCMAGYSLTQFISVLLLYWISTSYSQMQFLYIDMPIVTLLAWLSSKTTAYSSLATKPPPADILSVTSMVSLFGQLIIGGLAQIVVFCWVTTQSWFVAHVPTEEDAEMDRRSIEATSIFYVSIFHYIILYIVFAKGPPYRGPIYSNKPFLGALVAVTMLCLAIVITTYQPVEQFLGCVPIPFDFRLTILLIALGTAVVSFVFDQCLDTISDFIREQIRQQRKRN